MKLLSILLLLVCSCTNEVEIEEPAKEVDPLPSVPETPKPTIQEARKVCRIVKSVTSIRDCKLYTFICEDGSEELYLQCNVHPVGVITNPPRPI